jgi:hypothetical protein
MHAHPLPLYLPLRTKLRCPPAERADTLPLLLLYPYLYSVGTTLDNELATGRKEVMRRISLLTPNDQDQPLHVYQLIDAGMQGVGVTVSA